MPERALGKGSCPFLQELPARRCHKSAPAERCLPGVVGCQFPPGKEDFYATPVGVAESARTVNRFRLPKRPQAIKIRSIIVRIQVRLPSQFDIRIILTSRYLHFESTDWDL